MSLWRSLSRLNIHLNNLNANQWHCEITRTSWFPVVKFFESNKNDIHTSSTRRDLMEFFDDEKNWAVKEVKVGRSWRVEELRIKSNSDLHKLWYVLLKEKNMLLTMEHEYKRQKILFPSPERIDKVEESMENIETVVRERNRAYFELETGETGERPTGMATNCFGLEYKYKMREYCLEKKYNKKYWEDQKLFNHTTDHAYVKDFLTRLEEKKRRIAIHRRWNLYKIACKLMKVFPNLDQEALKEKFPDVDIEAVKQDKLSRPHQGF